jgi:hypothetical protein
MFADPPPQNKMPVLLLNTFVAVTTCAGPHSGRRRAVRIEVRGDELRAAARA